MGAAACCNRDTASLVRFQAQPKWEISANGSRYRKSRCSQGVKLPFDVLGEQSQEVATEESIHVFIPGGV